MSDKGKSKSKKPLLVFVIFLAVVSVIGFAIWTASQQVKEELSSVGKVTKGSAPVQTSDIMEQSVDGSVVVPKASPIAQASQELEDKQRAEAISQGRSYLGKTRVIQEADDSTGIKSDLAEAKAAKRVDAPTAQSVNELGEEQTDVILKGADNSLKLTGKNLSTGDTVVLPLQDESVLTSEQRQIQDLRNQLAQSKPGQKADDYARMRQQAKNEEALRAQRVKEREVAVNNGAKSLFGGLPYVPDSGGKFKITYTKPKNIYQVGSSTVFSGNDAKKPAASALYRSDGGQTQPGVHPNYTAEMARLGAQLAGKDTASSREERQNTPTSKDVLFDAGEIAFARTTLPIDSDIPGPIRIEFLNSKAKGSIGFGKMELIQQAPGVALTLSSVIHEGKQIPVKAWALSPDTEKALFDNHVDHHYIQRFGGLFAGLFMTGFLESLTDTDVTTSNGETNSSTSAIAGTTERIVYSLATAAEGFLPILYNYANRPIQVEVPTGQTMYLLFEKQVLVTDTVDSVAQPVQEENLNSNNERNTAVSNVVETTIPLAVIEQANDSESTTEIWK